MAEEGVFEFPEDIERGPTTFQELKFLTLWEAWAVIPVTEVWHDAARFASDDTERDELVTRVLRELRTEGLVEIIRPEGDVQDALPLADEQFEQELASGTLWAWTPETTLAHIRWTPKGEQWRSDYERG